MMILSRQSGDRWYPFEEFSGPPTPPHNTEPSEVSCPGRRDETNIAAIEGRCDRGHFDLLPATRAVSYLEQASKVRSGNDISRSFRKKESCSCVNDAVATVGSHSIIDSQCSSSFLDTVATAASTFYSITKATRNALGHLYILPQEVNESSHQTHRHRSVHDLCHSDHDVSHQRHDDFPIIKWCDEGSDDTQSLPSCKIYSGTPSNEHDLFHPIEHQCYQDLMTYLLPLSSPNGVNAYKNRRLLRSKSIESKLVLLVEESL